MTFIASFRFQACDISEVKKSEDFELLVLANHNILQPQKEGLSVFYPHITSHWVACLLYYQPPDNQGSAHLLTSAI